MTTAEVLLKAADIIEEGNWYPTEKTGSCAWTAIRRAERHQDTPTADASGVLIRFLEPTPVLGDAAFAIWHWNDAPERTKEEVVAALRGAAESLAVPA